MLEALNSKFDIEIYETLNGLFQIQIRINCLASFLKGKEFFPLLLDRSLVITVLLFKMGH
jgi:hypothetical protein